MAKVDKHSPLTQAHHRLQMAIGAKATKEAMSAIAGWTPGDRPTGDRMIAQLTAITADRHKQSVDAAATYYAALHGGTPAIVRPTITKSGITPALYVTTFAFAGNAMRRGFSPQAAHQNALATGSASVARMALAGGRDLISASITAAGGKWIRVLSGTCDFCEQLAAAGAAVGDFQAHDNCMCSAEPVFRVKGKDDGDVIYDRAIAAGHTPGQAYGILDRAIGHLSEGKSVDEAYAAATEGLTPAAAPARVAAPIARVAERAAPRAVQPVVADARAASQFAPLESPAPAADSKLAALPRAPQPTIAHAGDARLVLRQETASLNPDFLTQRGAQINCPNTSAAAELRRRGYDVIANTVKENSAGKSAAEVSRMGFVQTDGEVRKFKAVLSHEKLLSNLAEMPGGSRGQLILQWNRGGGHILNWERMADGNGGFKTIFFDAQNGQVYGQTDELLRNVAANDKLQYRRVDDLVPTDALLKVVHAR